MNTLKTKVSAVLTALLFFTRIVCAEEQLTLTNLSSTTITGVVDTGNWWWVQTYSTVNPPANDSLLAAESVTVGQVSMPTNLTSATLEAFEAPKPNQRGSVWYRWQVTTSGTARIAKSQLIETQPPRASSHTPALSEESIFYEGGGIDWTGGGVISYQPNHPQVILNHMWFATISAYRDSGATQLSLIGSGDYLQFGVAAGEMIYVCLELYRTTSDFPGATDNTSLLPTDLYFDVTPPPSNDSFSSNLSIAESSGGSFGGYLLSATREPGEPDIGPAYSGASVWFHYKAATYGNVQIGAAESGLTLAIFTGSNLANLKLVASTTSGLINFFARENEVYHVAVYGDQYPRPSFYLPLIAPQYRLYEITLDALFPIGAFPHFYGVRGATMLLYAKTADAWQLVEVEAISNQATDLLIRPASAVDGQLRVITIDETLPAPTIQLRPFRATLIPTLTGIPGQTCAVSYSRDLINWSVPQIYTLSSTTLLLPGLSAAVPSHFFQVTQSLPQNPTPGPSIGQQMQQNPPDNGGVAPPVPPI